MAHAGEWPEPDSTVWLRGGADMETYTSPTIGRRVKVMEPPLDDGTVMVSFTMFAYVSVQDLRKLSD